MFLTARSTNDNRSERYCRPSCADVDKLLRTGGLKSEIRDALRSDSRRTRGAVRVGDLPVTPPPRARVPQHLANLAPGQVRLCRHQRPRGTAQKRHRDRLTCRAAPGPARTGMQPGVTWNPRPQDLRRLYLGLGRPIPNG